MMAKWIANYRTATEHGYGRFTMEIDIDDRDDYWTVAKAVFPHAQLIDMNPVYESKEASRD